MNRDRIIGWLPAAGLSAAILLITSSCNFPGPSLNDQVETQVAGTLRAAQQATETSRETQLAATMMSESALTLTSAAEPTATPTQTGTSTPTPTATQTPTITATATPTRTSTPAPVEIDMNLPSSGDGQVSGRNTGLLGVVLADASYGFNTGNGRLQVGAWIPTAGSLEEPSATGWLDRPFSVPSSLGSNVEAQVSGEVDWSGVLAGNGVAGAGADVTIVLKLLEGSRVIAQTEVHSREVREAALSVGGLTDSGGASPSLSANLVGGRQYIIRLEATCNATSGLISATVHCVFGPSDTYADGFVGWGGFTVLLVP